VLQEVLTWVVFLTRIMLMLTSSSCFSLMKLLFMKGSAVKSHYIKEVIISSLPNDCFTKAIVDC